MSGQPQGQYDDGYGHHQYSNGAAYQGDTNQAYNDPYDYGQPPQQAGEGYYDDK